MTESGTYRVFVEFGNNCGAEDDVIVRIFESPVLDELPMLFDICNGEKATIVANGSGYNNLQWYFNGNIINGSTDPTIEVAISGEYSVTVKNAGGCSVTRTTTVDTHSAPSVDLGQDVVACIGPEVTLFAGNEGTTYHWTKDGVSIPGNVNSILVSTNGIFAVTVTNDYDCVTTDDVMVTFVTGPTLDLGSDATICEGETYTINAMTNTPSASIIWNKNGIVIPLENNFSLEVTDAGEYEAVVFGGTPPCEVRSRVTVNVNPKPGINLGVDKAICQGDPFPTFDAGSNHKTYAWSYNGTTSGNTRTILADKSGIYSATVTNNFDCANTDEIRLTINPLPTLVIPENLDLCIGDTIYLEVESNATTFKWEKNGTLIPNATQNSLEISSEGSYAITVTSSANCSQNGLVLITERNPPSVDLGKDTILCPNQSLTLDPGQHSSYSWSNGTTTPTLVVNANPSQTEPTTYSVIVKNQYQCSASDSITIISRPEVIADIEADNVGVCNGEPVNLTATGGLFYVWSDPDNSLSSNNTAETVATPTKTTIYTVTVSDDCPGNTDSATLELKVFEPQNISAGKDTCLITGSTIRLQASGGVSYSWSPQSSIIGATNISNPEISIIDATTFIVTIVDTNGCAFSDSVYVCVEEDPLKFFKAVTMITPNGDGANDVLIFKGLDYYPDNTLTVFNRWGNVIYEAVGYQSSNAELFDGTKNGEPLPPDTYYYILQFDGKTFKNSLTIIRD
ncbi:MAG: gliding motility-associated C-terminal domain-containing protein [Saprospiraceae bacterium]